MLSSLNNFDPISFLGVDTNGLSNSNISSLQNELNGKIGEYILLKFSSFLSQDQVNKIQKATDGQEIITMLQEFVPRMEEKVLEEIGNFKADYIKALGESAINA